MLLFLLPLLLVSLSPLTHSLIHPPTNHTDHWRFLVLADWHGAEAFTQHGFTLIPSTHQVLHAIASIHDDYGGDLIVFPGDTQAGKWYREKYQQMFHVETQEEALWIAGRHTYTGMQYLFASAGYSELMVAIGDHELGGNPWPEIGSVQDGKTRLLGEFRSVFASVFGESEVLSRPKGTEFETTSYAKVWKNVLFVTVDAFAWTQPMTSRYWDRVKGEGVEGVVTCTVVNQHLTWLENVLQKAQTMKEVDHIIVQAHLPILQPVRKMNCSGQFMDGAEDSPFLKVMRKYHVDVYLAGEVHANTVSQDEGSELIQVVSRGNALSNFLTVDVEEDRIVITNYNEIGNMPKFNGQYEVKGRLVIDKSGKSRKVSSNGSLLMLKKNKVMVKFSFEELDELWERPVLGLLHDDVEETMVQNSMTVRNVVCRKSVRNLGVLGDLYDAQAGNLQLTTGIQGKAAKFTTFSRMAIYAMGPHTGGHEISYALWIQTNRIHSKQILLHYGDPWGDDESRKNVFTLMLEYGVPVLYSHSTCKLMAPSTTQLATDDWHHIVVSMPRHACKLSEVHMYINGTRVSTTLQGNNGNLFFHTAGYLSMGGFGHSKPAFDHIYPQHEPFEGQLDELYVWSRSVSEEEVRQLVAVQDVAPIKTLPSNTSCNDKHGRKWVNTHYQKQTCSFFHTQHGHKFCTRQYIRESCPFSCNACPNSCQDSEFELWISNEHWMKHCSFLDTEIGRQFCNRKRNLLCPVSCHVC